MLNNFLVDYFSYSAASITLDCAATNDIEEDAGKMTATLRRTGYLTRSDSVRKYPH